MQHQILNIHSHPLTSYFLHNAFYLQSNHQAEEYFINPKGTVGINIILEGECTYIYDNHILTLPPVWVFGLIDKPLRSKISANYKAVGFRFKPEFFQMILKGKIPELKNQVIFLEDMMLATESEWLLNQFSICKNEWSMIEKFNTFLQRNLHNKPIEKRVEHALAKIRKGESGNIEKLSQDLNISTTRLRTLFYNHIGIAPKDMIKIYRLQRALKSGIGAQNNLTQLAYNLGYYDQSHFIHEFKEFLGMSPLKYFSNEKLTYDFYNFDRWRLSSFASK